MDTKGKGKGGDMYWEIGVETYTPLILCMKYTTTENILEAQATLLIALVT